MPMHPAEVEFDVGRSTFSEVCGEQTKCDEASLEQFQVVLHFPFHI
jgi:hypothetical protein